MRINRGLLFWGLALITAGATALAVQQGYIDRDTLINAWRLWPVVLIAIGLSIVLARTPFSVLGTVVAALVLGIAGGALVMVGPSIGCTGDAPSDLEFTDGEFGGDRATVSLEFNCGVLDVATTDGSGWEAGTATSGDRDAELSSTDDSLTIRSEDHDGFDWDGGKQRWEVQLGSEVTYDLNVNVNAAETTLDLGDGSFGELDVNPNAGALHIDLGGATVEGFSLDMNAGAAEIRTDADTSLSGAISMNAGSVKLCTDDGAAIRITIDDNVAFGHNLDDSDLNRSGDTWTSDGFDDAERAIELRIDGNAASFELNPDGGCS